MYSVFRLCAASAIHRELLLGRALLYTAKGDCNVTSVVWRVGAELLSSPSDLQLPT